MWILFLTATLLTACSLDSAPSPMTTDASTVYVSSTPSITASPRPSTTLTSSPTQTTTPTHTPSSIPSETPTIMETPSQTPTPSITLTPTFDFPDITVLMTAHCRYGPGTAYLHAADLYMDDQGQLWNRNHTGTWLWVQFDKIHYPCWVAASVVEVNGDIFSVVPYFHPLPKSTLYDPVQLVETSRNNDTVVVSWEEVWMTEDDFRGYLIEAQVCQNGFFIDAAYHTEKSQISILDESTCTGTSNGKLYAVEKHGYTDPILIPWP